MSDDGSGGSFSSLKDVTVRGSREWVAEQGFGFVATSYGDVGEGTVVWRPPPGDPDGGHSCPRDRSSRARESSDRAARRAKAKVRRYCVQNHCSRMWTLTFAVSTPELRTARRALNRFMVRLREHLGHAVPYVAVPELHPGGHGIHWHLVLPPIFIDWAEFGRLWGEGHVLYSDGKRGAGVGGRELARRAAGYVSKYVTKDLEWVEPGAHRYEVAQGFTVRVERRVCVSLIHAQAWLCEGRETLRQWSSRDQEAWYGPACWWFDYG